MKARQFAILMIRLLALFGLVLSFSHIPATFSPHWGGRIYDVSGVFLLAVLSTFILPLLLWFLAPALSRFMAGDSESLVSSISALDAFRVGVCLSGLWVFINAIFPIVGISWTLFSSPVDLDIGTTLDLNRQLYSSLVTSFTKLIIGGILFFRADLIVAVAQKIGILDRDR